VKAIANSITYKGSYGKLYSDPIVPVGSETRYGSDPAPFTDSASLKKIAITATAL
jgi:hypothetical protein